MGAVISVGTQNFQSLRENEYFYIDKTDFIKEWWETGDEVTLITRPRRFGKTINMNMLECFFSLKYKERWDLFEGLSIWKEEKYRKLQGTYPVISLSFASVKARNLADAKIQLKMQLADLYEKHRFLLSGVLLSVPEKEWFQKITNEPAIVLEFKVRDTDAEKNLQDTVDAALLQIDEMKYDTKLLERGIKPEQIQHYGFAFEGRKVLIG